MSLIIVRSAGRRKIMFYFFYLLLDPLDLFVKFWFKNSLGILRGNALKSFISSLSSSLTYEWQGLLPLDLIFLSSLGMVSMPIFSIVSVSKLCPDALLTFLGFLL